MSKRRRKFKTAKRSAQYFYEQMGGEGEVATNVHHRRSRATGGSNNPQNLSRVPIKAHQEYNRLFRDGHMHPKEMAEMLTRDWIDPQWELIARKKGEPIEIIQLHQPKHDCTACPNYHLRQTLNPILKQMAQEALGRAFT